MKIPTQIWIFCVGIFLQHYTFLQKRTFCILCEKFFHFVRKATATYNIFEYIEGAYVSSENYRIPMTMITGSIEFSPSCDELLSLDFKLFIIGNKIMYMYEDIY